MRSEHPLFFSEHAYKDFLVLRVQGCQTPINTGPAPCFRGCQGCHKGVIGDPPQPSLKREGVISLTLSEQSMQRQK